MAGDQVPGTGYLCQAEESELHVKQWESRGALSTDVCFRRLFLDVIWEVD